MYIFFRKKYNKWHLSRYTFGSQKMILSFTGTLQLFETIYWNIIRFLLEAKYKPGVPYMCLYHVFVKDTFGKNFLNHWHYSFGNVQKVFFHIYFLFTI